MEQPENLAEQFRRLGPPPPAIDGIGLLLVQDGDVRLIENKAAIVRILGDRPVTASKGFLAELLKEVPGRWMAVRAVCFSHRSNGATTREASDDQGQ